MEITGTIHLLFEQAGTFKNVFKELGYIAYDYDIQNKFGQTDFVLDLFHQIENAYSGGNSIFDSINSDDLIIAFFPCIYFCAPSQINFTWGSHNYRNMTIKQKTDKILERNKKRTYYYELAIKMFAITAMRGLRLIMENPWSENTYLKANFIIPPTLIDNNRMLRGDYRVKPTAYWFINCKPTQGLSFQLDKLKEKKTHMTSRGSSVSGICSEERSMISTDYARNFICDNILGKNTRYTIPNLFD